MYPYKYTTSFLTLFKAYPTCFINKMSFFMLQKKKKKYAFNIQVQGQHPQSRPFSHLFIRQAAPNAMPYLILTHVQNKASSLQKLLLN
jgi:hypothetical protein